LGSAGVVAQNARRPLSSAFGEGCRVPSLLGSPGLHPVAAPSQHRKAGTAGHASASTAFRAVDVSAFFNLRDRYKKFAKYWGESRERIPNETLRSKITFHLWRRPSAVPRRVSLERSMKRRARDKSCRRSSWPAREVRARPRLVPLGHPGFRRATRSPPVRRIRLCPDQRERRP
jgi:hypothetical protein